MKVRIKKTKRKRSVLQKFQVDFEKAKFVKGEMLALRKDKPSIRIAGLMYNGLLIGRSLLSWESKKSMVEAGWIIYHIKSGLGLHPKNKFHTQKDAKIALFYLSGLLDWSLDKEPLLKSSDARDIAMQVQSISKSEDVLGWIESQLLHNEEEVKS